VGPYLPLDTHFAIGNFIRDAMNGGPIVIKGDGTPLRSYLYAADLAIWLWTIFVKGKSLRPYNVGSETSITIVETAQAVRRSINPSIRIEIQGIPNSGSSVEQYVPSTKHAQNELEAIQSFYLGEEIKRTVDYLREKNK
jgi:dTDP-glucose 4,6-dehydratase